MDCYALQSRVFFFLIFASLACADEDLVGTWESDSGSVTIQDDGTISLWTRIDSEEILMVSDLGFNDYPDEVLETFADLLRDRKIQVSLTGTWETRGGRLVTVYQTAEVMGWDELVDDIMEVATPILEKPSRGGQRREENLRPVCLQGRCWLLSSRL